MNSKKTGFLAMLLTAMLLGGCGNDTAGTNLGGAVGDTRERMVNGRDATGTNGYGSGTYSGGTAYWDGYGINSGKGMFGDTSDTGDTDGLRGAGEDLRDAADDVGRDIRNAAGDLMDGDRAGLMKN